MVAQPLALDDDITRERVGDAGHTLDQLHRVQSRKPAGDANALADGHPSTADPDQPVAEIGRDRPGPIGGDRVRAQRSWAWRGRPRYRRSGTVRLPAPAEPASAPTTPPRTAPKTKCAASID